MKYNKKIITVLAVMSVLFLSIFAYLTYFTLFKAEDIVSSNYNRRLWEKEENVLRGSIYDRSGVVLAKSSVDENGKQTREYPYGSLYTHVIGYNTKSYGKTNLELSFNEYLLKTESITEIIQYGMDSSQIKRGSDLVTTIDHSLMETAKAAMKGKTGAVVAIAPKTGEVLCLYSNPSFDPNEDALTRNWADLSVDENSPFLPRATKGLYAPGSTFKIVTSAAALENGLGGYRVKDEGSIKIDGHVFKNAGGKAYGELDLKNAFKYSSNVYFSSLGTKLGAEKLKKSAESFMITKELEFDIDVNSVKWPYEKMSQTDLASVGIGQGKLLTTPFHMANVAAAIANGGVMMKPYLVQRAVSLNGVESYRANVQVQGRVASTATAEAIADAMLACVESGTGVNASVRGVRVAGKTGTAQNEREGKDHAWFVGFAPKDDPQIAVAVFQEYSASSGGAACAPIAKEIIRQWLNK